MNSSQMAEACTPSDTQDHVEFHPGDVIMKCYPFVQCLTVASIRSRCYRCFKPNPSETCPDCNVVHYCELECMMLDKANEHSLECSLWNQIPSLRLHCLEIGLIGDSRLFLLRLLAMLKVSPDLFSVPWPSTFCPSMTFYDVVKHLDTCGQTPEMIHTCCALTDVVAQRPGTEYNPNARYWDLRKLAAVFQLKRIGIMDESSFNQIGWGFYIIPASMMHSCRPSAFLCQTNGPELEVRAIAHVPRYEHPTVSYLDEMLDITERNYILKNLYNVQCFCKRCRDKTELYVNFEQLRVYLKEVTRLMKASPIQPCLWGELYAKHEDVIRTFSLMYEEYDLNVTELYHMMIVIGMRMGIEKSTLNPLFEQTLDHLAKTYGNGHQKYLTFVEATVHYFN